MSGARPWAAAIAGLAFAACSSDVFVNRHGAGGAAATSGTTTTSGTTGGGGGATSSTGGGGSGGGATSSTGGGGATSTTGSGGSGTGTTAGSGGGGSGGGDGGTCTPPTVAPSVAWVKQAGPDANLLGIVADPSENVLITGRYWGPVDFGLGPLGLSGGDGLFIAKADPSGAPLWSKGFGDEPGFESGFIKTDGAGDAIVAGSFLGSLDFGGGALPDASNDATFVAELDPSGAYRWSTSFFGITGSGPTPTGVAVDAVGDVIVLGTFAGTVWFGIDGGHTLTTSDSGAVFIVKLDPSGSFLWATSLAATGTGSVYMTDIAVDGADDIFVSGYVQGSATLCGASLTAPGVNHIFLAKLDPTGDCLWAQDLGDPDAWTHIAADSDGNVAVVGSFNGHVVVAGQPLTAPEKPSSAFVAELDGDGATLWVRAFYGIPGGASVFGVSPYGVATDSARDVIVGGQIAGAASFGCGPPIGDDATTGNFLAALDPSGALLWADEVGACMGGACMMSYEAMGVDASGNAYLGADFSGPITVGSDPLTGQYQLFFAKVSP